MKLAYVTLFDANDVLNWSGTDKHIWRALETAGAKVSLIDRLGHGPSLKRKCRKWWSQMIEKRSHLHFWDTATAKSFAADVHRRIQGLKVDAVVSPSPVPLAYLDCPAPKILWTDSTFDGLCESYPEYSRDVISSASYKCGRAIDRAIASHCDVRIYSSTWAASHASKDAPGRCRNVHVVPFGANLEIHHDGDDVEEMTRQRILHVPRLLFMGVGWQKKGADKAVAITREVRNQGIDATLTIVGSTPPADWQNPGFVEIEGFVAKDTQAGLRRIEELYKRSSFLVLPTLAEAYGIVFAEASAYGVPSLSHAIGGIPTVVTHGINGYLFDPAQPASDWADQIAHLWSSSELFMTASQDAWSRYQEALRWDKAADSVLSIIGEKLILQSRTRRSRALPGQIEPHHLPAI